MSDDDKAQRHGWIILVAVILAMVGFTSCQNQPSAVRQINCTTGDSESCYYTDSNKPTPPSPQSVSFNGMTVPTVGVLPPSCAMYTACTFLGNVGVWAVWDTNPKGTSMLESTYGPPSSSSG